MSFGRLERTPGPTPMSEINMTPLIDVMLVLLVIFIITAPLMTSSLKLDLPRADAATPTQTPTFVAVSVNAQGQLFLADEPIARDALERRLTEAARANAQTEVQLRADKAVAYGQVADVIGLAQKAGLTRIGFVAQAQAEPAPAEPVVPTPR
jgi:biopolymer transport protein TolR